MNLLMQSITLHSSGQCTDGECIGYCEIKNETACICPPGISLVTFSEYIIKHEPENWFFSPVKRRLLTWKSQVFSKKWKCVHMRLCYTWDFKCQNHKKKSARQILILTKVKLQFFHSELKLIKGLYFMNSEALFKLFYIRFKKKSFWKIMTLKCF